MKILILNASPRIGGNIATMLQVIQQECEAQGAEVESVWVQNLSVKPCMAWVRHAIGATCPAHSNCFSTASCMA